MDRQNTTKKNALSKTGERPIADSQVAEELELSTEPGMESAIHDIQMLAKRYQQAEAAAPASDSLELCGVSMTPNFLLTPKVAARRESWKGVALGLMVMLGLSTSALALSLYNNANSSEDAAAPRLLEFDAPAFLPASAGDVSELARSFPHEPPIYQVVTAPGTTAVPEAQRESVAPLVAPTRSAKRTASAGTGRIVQSDTCDEVACLIDASGACCQQFESVRANQDQEEELHARPYRLTRNEIMKPMQSLSKRVEQCAATYGAKDVATVKLTISEQGAITTLHVDHGSPAFQSCVEEQVRTLRFRELSQPFQFSYPYRLN